MKKVALSIAALLVLAVVSPAFSQPFADVPTDHWAFDAIAELAAKGLVEGYPDGTFKGDRAMTRYEMAMVVARILARVEAIKIPPPPPPVKIPPPEVTRADIQTLQRLINEFRAELAALGVRVTAVEEELAAVRARLDNTKVTGFVFFRYQANLLSPGTNYTYGLFNVTFTGRISSTASATVNMLLTNINDGGVFGFGSTLCNVTYPSETPAGCAGQVDAGGYPSQGVSFDRAYLDVAAYGLSWRLGRQSYRLGPIGLLFSEGSLNVWGGDSVGIDGLKVAGSFGPLSFEAAGFTAVYNPNLTAALSLLMGRASMQLMPGWTMGANFYSERTSQNAFTPFQTRGVTSSNGWSVDLAGTIIPGITLAAEYAAYSPSSSLPGGPWPDNTAYQVNTVWNLAQLTGMTQFSPTLRIQYKKFGTNFVPIYRGSGDLFGIDYTNNYRAWNAQLSLTISPLFRPYLNYESGTVISTSQGVTELELGFFSQITSGVTGRFRYQRREQPAGTLLTHRYRLQIDASW